MTPLYTAAAAGISSGPGKRAPRSGALPAGRVEARVGLFRLRRARLRARAVALRQLRDGVEELLLFAAGADHEDRARPVSRPHEDVVDPGRHVDEVPRLQLPFLPFPEQQALSGEKEEVLLQVLPVVEAVRFPRLEHADVDPELVEGLLGILKPHRGAEGVVRPPLGVAHVDDEPVAHVRWKYSA